MLFVVQTTKKRKKPGSSSGRANSSGTANTGGPSPGSAPSTPSTHTPGDPMPVPQLQQNGVSAKPLVMFGSDGTGSLTSTANPLVYIYFDVNLFLDNDNFLFMQYDNKSFIAG
jgi:hypothetical protein